MSLTITKNVALVFEGIADENGSGDGGLVPANTVLPNDRQFLPTFIRRIKDQLHETATPIWGLTPEEYLAARRASEAWVATLDESGL